MIKAQLKVLDDEYRVVSDDTKAVGLRTAKRMFGVVVGIRSQGIRVHFERCDEREIAISTDIARDGLAVGLRFTPRSGSKDFLALLEHVNQLRASWRTA